MDGRPVGGAHRAPNPAPASELPPAEVAEFIRYAYRRRRVGWPEIYDDMCAIASRREFRGWDHARLAEAGITFSLQETPRLAAWVRTVLPRPSTISESGAARAARAADGSAPAREAVPAERRAPG